MDGIDDEVSHHQGYSEEVLADKSLLPSLTRGSVQAGQLSTPDK